MSWLTMGRLGDASTAECARIKAKADAAYELYENASPDSEEERIAEEAWKKYRDDYFNCESAAPSCPPGYMETASGCAWLPGAPVVDSHAPPKEGVPWGVIAGGVALVGLGIYLWRTRS